MMKIFVIYLLLRKIYFLRNISRFSNTTIGYSQWRLILAVDYQFSTNLVPLVTAPAFVPLITPWLPLSPPAGYIRSALHITTRYISTIVPELTSLAQTSRSFSSSLTINFFTHDRDNAFKNNFVTMTTLYIEIKIYSFLD